MVLKSNYKKIPKNFKFLDCPVLNFKVLKFKRSKWSNFKIKIIKKIKKKKKFFFAANTRRVGFLRFWKKISKSYKRALGMNHFFQSFYQKSFSLSDFKKQLSDKKKVLSSFYVKPLLKLDVFLWKLRLFRSVKEARQFIQKRKLRVNNTVVSRPIFLKKGDVLDLGFSLNPLFNKCFFLSNDFFLSLCEVDFYSGTFILLKDSTFFEREDISLSLVEKINIRSFLYYLLKN